MNMIAILWFEMSKAEEFVAVGAIAVILGLLIKGGMMLYKRRK